MVKITETQAKSFLRRDWLAGIPPEEFKAHKGASVTLAEAGNGDFFNMDMSERELRRQTGFKGKICAIRDAENIYTFSLIKCGRKR